MSTQPVTGNQYQLYPHTPTPPFLSEEEVTLLKRTMLSRYPEDEQETFIRICQRTKLDPFTKQIHPTKRYQKVKDENGSTRKVPTLVPVTGIMGLCAVAERTGNYDGCEITWAGADGIWRNEWLFAEPPEAAKCVVYHKHRKYPEIGIARWNSYVGMQWNQDTHAWEVTDFWNKMPDYMLAKCAKAQGLRGAFPDQLSNVYIREELDSHLTDSEADIEAEQAATRQRIQEASERARAELQEEQPPQEPVKAGGSGVGSGITVPVAAVTEAPPQPKPAAPPPEPPPAPEIEPATDALENITPMPDQRTDDGAEPLADPPWKTHLILGLRHAKFYKRTVGSLSQPELAVLQQQWIPAVRAKWETEANDSQKADVTAMEAAIAFYNMSRPW